jgi:hypothetical protein
MVQVLDLLGRIKAPQESSVEPPLEPLWRFGSTRVPERLRHAEAHGIVGAIEVDLPLKRKNVKIPSPSRMFH